MTSVIEKLLAGATLVVCVVLLLRLVLPAAQRQRFDGAARSATYGARRAARKARAAVVEPYRAWRLKRSAHRMADEAIRRARDGGNGEWTGNVYRPKSFQRPPKKDLERPRKER